MDRTIFHCYMNVDTLLILTRKIEFNVTFDNVVFLLLCMVILLRNLMRLLMNRYDAVQCWN